MKKPNITLLATGGTIAGSGNSSIKGDYTSGGLHVEELISDIPDLDKVANIQGEQIANIGSQAMDDEILLRLAKRVDELLLDDGVDGIVVIHGTDTLEESAYFLNLTIKSKKPIIFTGAMRSSSSISSDGAMNILNAISVASCKKSQKMGVLVVINDEIHSAREVTKIDTTSLNAFSSPNSGKVGVVHYGKVSFYMQSLKKHTYKSEFDIKNINSLPKIDIIYSHLNGTDTFVKASIKSGTKGIISAGFGNGNIYPTTLKALHVSSQKGIIVVRSSRVGSGKVSTQGEIDDKKYGFITADNLNPQKARILLSLALLKTNRKIDIQKIFFKY